MAELLVEKAEDSELSTERRHRFGERVVAKLLRRHENSVGGVLGATLKNLDNMIPSNVADYDADTGMRYDRQKQFHPKEAKRTIGGIFEHHFASQQEDLLGATNDLLSELVVDSLPRDTAPLGQIDRFLANYPQNILTNLGYEATSEVLLDVLHGGVQLLQIDKERPDPLRLMYYRGKIANLLGSSLPRLVASEGPDCLEKVETIAREQGISQAHAFIEFRLKYKGEMPELPFTAQDLVSAEAPESPFTHENENRAWGKEAWMGAQVRPPEWGDLGHMTAVTEQWDREYGLSMREEDGEVTLGFIRGTEGNVSNRNDLARDGKRLFFHSHPSEGTEDGLLAPLISPGDITGTDVADHGGGYLNIVCRNGITLQIDSKVADSQTPKGWRIESGYLEGMTISRKGRGTSRAIAIMKEVHDTQEPFAYSITTDDYEDSRTITFVHVPWQHLNHQEVTLHDVCFGEGLPKIIPSGVERSGEVPDNLYESLQKAKSGL